MEKTKRLMFPRSRSTEYSVGLLTYCAAHVVLE